jgi:hypothetical protein
VIGGERDQWDFASRVDETHEEVFEWGALYVETIRRNNQFLPKNLKLFHHQAETF